jgi:hypothetical protein
MDLKMGFWSCRRIKLLLKPSIYLSLLADVSIPKPKNTLQLQKPSLEVHNFSREFFLKKSRKSSMGTFKTLWLFFFP